MRAVLVAILLLTSAPVRAQEPDSASRSSPLPKTHEGRANRLAHEAKLRFDANDFASALALFQEARELAQSPVFDLYIARSERALGHYRRALVAYRELGALAVDSANPPWARAQSDALVELAALERELPRVTVSLSEPQPSAPISALLDGESCPWPIANRGVDPGEHQLTLRAGDVTVQRNFQALAAKTSELRIAWPTPTRPTHSPPHAATPTTARELASRRPDEQTSLAPWMWTSFGLAAVATAVGTTTGIMVLSEASSLRAWCQADGHVCHDGKPEDPAQRNAQANAERLAVASNVAFVVAGAAALGGVVLFALDRPRAQQGPQLGVQIQLDRLVFSGKF